MFLTTKKFPSGLTYLYLMDSKYDSATKRTKVFIYKSFGNYDEFVKNEPEAYAELVKKYGEKRRKKKEDIRESGKNFINKQVNSDGFIAINDIKNSVRQCYSHLVIKQIWQNDLAMNTYFDYLVFHNGLEIEYNISRIALYFITLKIMYPMSYHAGLQESTRFLGDPMNGTTADDAYRCLRLLANFKDSVLKHVSGKIDKLIPREKSLLFYDCTNCYFETPCNDEYWYHKKGLRVLRMILRKRSEIYDRLSDQELNGLIETTPELTDELDSVITSFGNPLRMHGDSKEKRLDLPIVSIALVVDENAIPIDFQIYAGNDAEATTMAESIQKLKKKHKIKNAVIVADSALNGTKNLSMLLEEGMGFSVAKSALSFCAEIRNKHLKLDTFEAVKDEAGQETGFKYKVIPYRNSVYDKSEREESGRKKKYTIDCKLMLTFSETRKERDLAILDENIKRAQQAVDKHEEIKTGQSGWKQLVIKSASESAKDTNGKSKTEISSNSDSDSGKDSAADNASKSSSAGKSVAGDKTKKTEKKQSVTCIATSLDKKAIEKRKLCAGFSGILYHKPPKSKEEDFKAEYVSSLYHKLVQIEECFRIMKNEFEIRPLYVRDRESVTGHVLLCVLALIIVRIIQNKFKNKEKSITPNKLQKLMREFNFGMLRGKDNKCVYLDLSEISKRENVKTLKNKSDNDSEMETGHDVSAYDLIQELFGSKLPVASDLEQLRKYFKARTIDPSSSQLEKLDKMCQSATAASAQRL